MLVFDQAAASQGLDPFHMFFLCDPDSPVAPWSPGGQNAWCHAHSPDLMTQWTIVSPAIPGPSAPGTGNVVALGNSDIPRNASVLPASTGAVAFTAGAFMTTSSAKDVEMLNWTALSTSPLIPPPPRFTNCSLIGDVSVSHRINSGGIFVWTMVVGSAVGNNASATQPTALLYESMDLKNW